MPKIPVMEIGAQHKSPLQDQQTHPQVAGYYHLLMFHSYVLHWALPTAEIILPKGIIHFFMRNL